MVVQGQGKRLDEKAGLRGNSDALSLSRNETQHDTHSKPNVSLNGIALNRGRIKYGMLLKCETAAVSSDLCNALQRAIDALHLGISNLQPH